MVVSALVAPSGVQVGPATLTKGVRVSIVSRAAADSGSVFRLRFVGVGRPPDAGGSVRVVEARRVEVLAGNVAGRRLWGTESLQGVRGSLTLRWSAEQARASGRWGPISGRWSVVAASDAYSGCVGYGELSADARFQTTVHSGRLITAV